jgi:hypothetical protein
LAEEAMAEKKSNIQWIIALGAAVLFGVLAYSTFQQTRVRYEVCVVFKGATHCATAAGSSYDQAVRSAQEIDCQMLSNGRDENMVCLGNPPSSVRQVK